MATLARTTTAGLELDEVQQLVLALPPAGFLHLETFEVLHRSWHVTARSVRPDHRMVAHTGFVTIARAARTVTYPSRFTLAAALNPCPCGFFNDGRRECTCTPQQIARYLAKVSGPLLDRIDLQVEVPALTSEEVTATTAGEPSASIRERVERARAVQRERFRRTHIRSNAEMTTRLMRRHCELDAASRALLRAAIERLGLSARAHDRILKVARTIADLAGEEAIGSGPIAEAVQYRALDRAYFRTG